MKSMKKVFGITILIVLLFVSWQFLFNDSFAGKGKWQWVYYPDGCLSCEDNYIWSPFFNSVNECINWVHQRAELRSNSNDAAECSFNCKENSDWWGIMICDETVDVLGSPSF